MEYTLCVIIDGKAISDKIKSNLSAVAKKFEKVHGRKCCLAIVLVGANPSSVIYINNKTKDCEAVGITSIEHRLGEKTTEAELCFLIKKLNLNRNIDGILVQLPLPKQINEQKILQTIAPEKDVDGFGNGSPFTPCTPLGILELIRSTGVPISGKHAVVVGRSNIVGKPTAKLLLDADCTVTIAHSKTQNLASVTRLGDILVVAVGRAKIVTADMVKRGAIVIDVGINRAGDGKICGDVDFEPVQKVASYITPVPGGVGLMTRAMLLKNVLRA
jgi:methylenetetrahydrofolate dehydrogenase (NADP+)/methenyltetrahydrofolate cyclohydrolase